MTSASYNGPILQVSFGIGQISQDTNDIVLNAEEPHPKYQIHCDREQLGSWTGWCWRTWAWTTRAFQVQDDDDIKISDQILQGLQSAQIYGKKRLNDKNKYKSNTLGRAPTSQLVGQ